MIRFWDEARLDEVEGGWGRLSTPVVVEIWMRDKYGMEQVLGEGIVYKSVLVSVLMSRDELRDVLGKGGIILVVVISALSILNLFGIIGRGNCL